MAVTNHTALCAEIRKQLYLRSWKCKDLAKATGYTTGTIYAFMSGSRVNDKIAEAIAKALDIPPHMAT